MYCYFKLVFMESFALCSCDLNLRIPLKAYVLKDYGVV